MVNKDTAFKTCHLRLGTDDFLRRG